MNRFGIIALLPVFVLLSPAPGGAEEEDGAVDIFAGKAGQLEVVKADFPAVREAEAEDRMKKAAPKTGLYLLPEGSRAKFEEFAKKAGAAKRELLKPPLDKVVADLAEEGKLDGDAKAALAELAEKTLDEASQLWQENLINRYAPSLVQTGDPETTISQWSPESFANSNIATNTPLEDLDIWKEGLRKILKPEHAAALEAAAKEKKERLLKELEGYLEDAEAQTAQTLASRMDQEVFQILRYVELDETRAKALQAAADEAVAATAKVWREKIAGELLAMSEKNRQQITQRQGNFGIDFSEDVSKPEMREGWIKVSEATLTEEEKQLVEKGRNQFRRDRAEAMAMVMISEMDRFVGFDSNQREQLRQLGTVKVMTLPADYFAAGGNGFTYLDSGQIFSKLKEITDEDLAKVMTPGQLKRWAAVTPAQLLNNRTYSRAPRPDNDPGTVADMDEIEAERLISHVLDKEARRLREIMLNLMESRVENIVRATSLSEAETARLLTAAKGAAEQMSRTTVLNLDQYVHQQLRTVKPQELPGRLGKLSLPTHLERQLPGEPRLWTAALDRLLTPEQQALWQKEQEAREDWQERSLATLAATEVAKRLTLTAEKNDLLIRHLGKVIQKYGQDISSMLSTNWYLQSYYASVPVALLSKAQQRAVFTKEEVEKLTINAPVNGEQYAEMIRQRYRSRTQRK